MFSVYTVGGDGIESALIIFRKRYTIASFSLKLDGGIGVDVKSLLQPR